MVKKACVTNSKLVQYNVLKAKKNGIRKQNSFENAIRNALRAVHNEVTNGNRKTVFKRPKPKTKVNNVSRMMSRCSVTVKHKPKPYSLPQKPTFLKIMKNIKQNKIKQNARAKNRKMREIIGKLGRL